MLLRHRQLAIRAGNAAADVAFHRATEPPLDDVGVVLHRPEHLALHRRVIRSAAHVSFPRVRDRIDRVARSSTRHGGVQCADCCGTRARCVGAKVVEGSAADALEAGEPARLRQVQ